MKAKKRAIPIHMTDEQVAAFDAVADVLGASRNGVVWAFIAFGRERFSGSALEALRPYLPVVDYGRGRTRSRKPAASNDDTSNK